MYAITFKSRNQRNQRNEIFSSTVSVWVETPGETRWLRVGARERRGDEPFGEVAIVQQRAAHELE